MDARAHAGPARTAGRAAGQCKPEPGGDCGSITGTGKCEGDILIFCSAEKIYMVDCAVTGEDCKWDSGANAFGCL